MVVSNEKKKKKKIRSYIRLHWYPVTLHIIFFFFFFFCIFPFCFTFVPFGGWDFSLLVFFHDGGVQEEERGEEGGRQANRQA